MRTAAVCGPRAPAQAVVVLSPLLSPCPPDPLVLHQIFTLLLSSRRASGLDCPRGGRPSVLRASDPSIGSLSETERRRYGRCRVGGSCPFAHCRPAHCTRDAGPRSTFPFRERGALEFQFSFLFLQRAREPLALSMGEL